MSIVNEEGEIDFRSDKVKEIDKQLDAIIALIEKEHQSYFANKKTDTIPPEQDCLKNHIWRHTDNSNFYNYGFKPNSDIDESIKQKVIKGFDEVLLRYK